MYSKYINFLIQHNLFDKGIFQYLQKNLVFIPFKSIDEYHSIGCTIILNHNEKLVGFIPCVPYLENDKAVAINIFVYVQALMLLPNIGKVYDERDYDYTLPFIFQKHYILETKNISLLEYHERMILHQFQEKDLPFVFFLLLI